MKLEKYNKPLQFLYTVSVRLLKRGPGNDSNVTIVAGLRLAAKQKINDNCRMAQIGECAG